MLIRAALVVLVCLNLGVAAWWAAGGAVSAPAPADAPEAAGPPLELWRPAAPAMATAPKAGGATAAPAPAPDEPPPAAPVAVAAPAPACVSLGPFADEAAARAALAALGQDPQRSVVRPAPGRGASAYTVWLPPQPDREQALALAERIGQAGFDDFLVIPSGEQANSIALGRYRSVDAAERRRADLQAKGFPAQVQPVGATPPPQWWLDVVLPAPAAASAQARAGAAQSRPLACAAVR